MREIRRFDASQVRGSWHGPHTHRAGGLGQPSIEGQNLDGTLTATPTTATVGQKVTLTWATSAHGDEYTFGGPGNFTSPDGHDEDGTANGSATVTSTKAGTVGYVVGVYEKFGAFDCASQPVKVTYTAANQPPTAQNSAVTTKQDTAVATPLKASDADNDPLTYSVDTQPSNGTLSGTAPNLTYMPNNV